MRHDELRDLLAGEMRQIFKDVETEPRLSPLSGETLYPRSAISTDDARFDIRARGFWCRQRNAFFDIRVFYPHASSYLHRSIPAMCLSLEKSKKREYNDRVLQVEHATFTPLVFASTGAVGREATAVLKALDAKKCEKFPGTFYSEGMRLLRCRISFALLRAAHVCLRGTRKSSRPTTAASLPTDLVLREARM